MKILKTPILIIVLFFIAACSTLKKSEKTVDGFPIPAAYTNYKCMKYNGLLILTNVAETNLKYPDAYLDLVVFDSLTNKELLKDHLRNGKLEWVNESKFKVTYTPGNPEKEKVYFFYYDLISKTKNDPNQRTPY